MDLVIERERAQETDEVVDTRRVSRSDWQPATVDDTGLRSGRIRIEAVIVRGSAVRLKEVLERECGHAVWVQAVVTVWGDLVVDSPIERDRVLYSRGEDLVDVLRNRPERLSAREAGELAVAVEAWQRFCLYLTLDKAGSRR